MHDCTIQPSLYLTLNWRILLFLTYFVLVIFRRGGDTGVESRGKSHSTLCSLLNLAFQVLCCQQLLKHPRLVSWGREQ